MRVRLYESERAIVCCVCVGECECVCESECGWSARERQQRPNTNLKGRHFGDNQVRVFSPSEASLSMYKCTVLTLYECVSSCAHSRYRIQCPTVSLARTVSRYTTMRMNGCATHRPVLHVREHQEGGRDMHRNMIHDQHDSAGITGGNTLTGESE